MARSAPDGAGASARIAPAIEATEQVPPTVSAIAPAVTPKSTGDEGLVIEPLVIEPAAEEDFPAITAIYAQHVLHGTATFETEPPSLAEMQRRWRDYTAQGFPWLVARRAGRVVGYAYAAPYRTRPAYRFTVEDSVYVDAGASGQGAGGALLQALVDACEHGGFRQMIAVIGDSANVASIGLHRARGFELIGVQRAVGFKFERWLDCVLMQRELQRR